MTHISWEPLDHALLKNNPSRKFVKTFLNLEYIGGAMILVEKKYDKGP